MAIFTLTEIEEQLTAYKQALLALSKAQSHELDTAGFRRKVTRADLPEIRRALEWLERQKELVAGVTGINRINVARVRR